MLWLLAAKPRSLDAGTKALADLRAEDAVTYLEQARREGPYTQDEHIRVYEELGIAYAYLDRTADALGAFDMLLALDPGHAISYTLSPKVTFLFEKARSKAADRAPPNVTVAWPLGLTVSDPVPLDLEVIADPLSFLKRAKVFTRLKGSSAYQALETNLPPVGGHRALQLDAPAPSATQPQVLDLYLLAYDAHGNEVYLWGSPQRPREVPLRYQPPDAWYQHWWVWAVAGTVLAAGASTAVFIATRTPSSTVGGNIRVVP